MLFINYKEYNLEFLKSDIFLNLFLDKGIYNFFKLRNKVILNFMWVSNNLDLMVFHYNCLLFFFFFGYSIYIKKIRQGRSNKNLFFIVELYYKFVNYQFLNFFLFDFLRYFFLYKDNFFGKNIYVLKYNRIKSLFFFRLYDFDLFFNKRLSNYVPLFFPIVKYPFNIEICFNFISFFENKIIKKI